VNVLTQQKHSAVVVLLEKVAALIYVSGYRECVRVMGY